MKNCSRCGNGYPEPFQFCPVDGGELGDDDGGTPPEPRDGTSISLRTLVRALLVLVGVAFLAFAGVFLYYYLKPKYGGMVVKTTPPGANVVLDGKPRGVTPLTIPELRAGGHQVRLTKEGYKETVQQVEVLPYSTENVHWSLEPLVAHLTNEQLAEIESWRKKLDNATRENILVPPPDDYNAVFFANKILAIDPANAYAHDVKTKISESIRQLADLAYAREDWIAAEKHYKSLATISPNDISINERLTDIATKIEASVKDREKQIADWRTKAEAALKIGALIPPEKDNALDALNTILRLDKKNAFARETLVRVKEMLQNRGDTKIAGGDWQGAQMDFRLVLQNFPEDSYSKSRLQMIEGKLGELASVQQQQARAAVEEQQSKARVVALRQSALASSRSGAHAKAIGEWQEYLKVDPNSDEAYYYLGLGYLEQKQLDTAILNFEKAVSLNPSNAAAHLNLGLLYDRHRNNMALAVDHLKKVKDLGAAEKYSPGRIQARSNELQASAQLDQMQQGAFPVEHKHAFSSCRGSLRVADAGIEYRTSETDHSFFEAYGGLRGFSVQGDELSIRIRNNKKYNFHLLNAGDAERIKRLAARHTQVSE